MKANSTKEELNKMFPTWFKKTQITFSGEYPSTEDEQQQVFVVPYSVFEVAIETLIQRKQLEARIEELETVSKYQMANPDCQVCRYNVVWPNERIAELKDLKEEK